MTTKQEQCLLTYLGYNPGTIDGVDGPKTQAALAAFTDDYGVGEEGLVGAVAGTVAKKSKPPDTGTQSTTQASGWKYFTYAEVRCKCGGRYCKGDTKVSDKLMACADQIREHFGRPMEITSGVRCYEYNLEVYRKLGKTPVTNSAHISGKAIDFRINGVTAAEILAYAKTLPLAYRYAVNDRVVHINV